jgi:copper transport protein
VVQELLVHGPEVHALSVTQSPEHGAVPAPPLRERPAAGLRRAFARLLLVVLGAVASLVIVAGPASAHADLVRSDPGNGTTVALSPAVVRLWFSEDISARVSTARLVRGDGSTVAGTRVAVVTSDERPRLELHVPQLGTGTYGVLWQVLATDDGHTTSGTVVFSVGTASDATALTAGSADSPQGPTVVLRWLRVVLLAGLVGGVAVVVAVLGPVGRRARDEQLAVAVGFARARVLALAAASAALSVVVGLLVLFDEVGRLTVGASPWMSTARDLAGTRWAQLWLTRELVLVALLVALVALRRQAHDRDQPRPLTAAVVAATLGVVWIEALGSHAASVDSQRSATVLADAVHVLAGCIWLGVLPALLLVLWPRSGSAGRSADGTSLVRAAAGPLGRLVAGSVAVVVATGLYGAGRQVGTVEELATTSYGRALVVKTVLLLALLAVGAVSASRLHDIRLPSAGRRRRPAASEGGGGRPLTGRLVAVEAVVGVLLLLVVALLAETPPPRDQAAAASAPTPASSSGQVDDVVVSVTVSPNVPGPNGFAVVVASTRRPPPAIVDDVQLVLSGPGAPAETTLRSTGTDRWFGTVPLPASGPAQLTVVVHRAGHTLQVPLSWQVEPAAAQRDEAPGGHALAPYVDGIALALLGAAAVTLLVRRRRSGAVSTAAGPDTLVASRRD